MIQVVISILRNLLNASGLLGLRFGFDSQREYQAAHGGTLACELVEPRW